MDLPSGHAPGYAQDLLALLEDYNKGDLEKAGTASAKWSTTKKKRRDRTDSPREKFGCGEIQNAKKTVL